MRVRSATSGWRRDGWRRWSWAYRGPAEELDRLGGGETEREVDDDGEQIEFDQMSFPVRRHRDRRHEVVQADDIDQRGVLKQGDALRQQDRQHFPDRLRQDHEAIGLKRTEAGCDRGHELLLR